MKVSILTIVLLLICFSARANLLVTVESTKLVGQKAVFHLAIENAYKEEVESARATLFLIDKEGKMVGQSSKWVIGASKDRPSLAPGKKITYNFVVDTDKSFATNRLTFNRIILQGGRIVNSPKSFEIQSGKSKD